VPTRARNVRAKEQKKACIFVIFFIHLIALKGKEGQWRDRQEALAEPTGPLAMAMAAAEEAEEAMVVAVAEAEAEAGRP
jgi:hypothetical protein